MCVLLSVGPIGEISTDCVLRVLFWTDFPQLFFSLFVDVLSCQNIGRIRFAKCVLS